MQIFCGRFDTLETRIVVGVDLEGVVHVTHGPQGCIEDAAEDAGPLVEELSLGGTRLAANRVAADAVCESQ